MGENGVLYYTSPKKMNLFILAELDTDDAAPYLDEISAKGKSAVFKAMLLSFRVSSRDLLEYYSPPVELSFPIPGWEIYEELGYILAWNMREGKLIFGQKETNS